MRAAELVELGALMAADDLDGLRRWLANCEACEGRDGAQTRVAELEAEERYAAEAETIQTALRLRNTDAIARWLETCELCAVRDEAEAALSRIESETAAAAACVAAAGLPQHGGPRLLTDIDQENAAEICDAVLSSYPDSALAATVRGRVALASGDPEAALVAYLVGMDAGLPQAFGLAAHNAYAPLDETEADYTLAETFALRGFEAGDWYSGEVLVVLYSRELVPGRTASDAFDIALAHGEDGNPVAQFFAGFFLATGTGTAPDIAEAVRWYEASVAQGYAHAAPFLAEILEVGQEAEGETPAVAAEPERAATIYLDAIAAGDPTALERLTVQVRDRPREVVREVQTRLRDAGVFSSVIDGIGGPATARAVTAFYELNQDDADE